MCMPNKTTKGEQIMAKGNVFERIGDIMSSNIHACSTNVRTRKRCLNRT